jgi:hypothetical protein
MYQIRTCFVMLKLLSKDSQCQSLSFSNCLLSGLSVHQRSPKFGDFCYPPTIRFLLNLDCEPDSWEKPCC